MPRPSANTPVSMDRDREGHYVAFCPSCEDASIIAVPAAGEFRVLARCDHLAGVTLDAYRGTPGPVAFF